MSENITIADLKALGYEIQISEIYENESSEWIESENPNDLEGEFHLYDCNLGDNVLTLIDQPGAPEGANTKIIMVKSTGIDGVEGKLGNVLEE